MIPPLMQFWDSVSSDHSASNMQASASTTVIVCATLVVLVAVSTGVWTLFAVCLLC